MTALLIKCASNLMTQESQIQTQVPSVLTLQAPFQKLPLSKT